MTQQIIVLEQLKDWPEPPDDCPIVHVDDYLVNAQYNRPGRLQVINLCRSQRYLSVGYYCSLLAEARGHRVIPSVKTMLDLSRKSIYRFDAQAFDEKVQKGLRGREAEGRFSVDIFFGTCGSAGLAGLARHIFERFAAPMLQVEFEWLKQRWRIASIRPLPLNALSGEQRGAFEQALMQYRGKPWRTPKGRQPHSYDMAILHNPDDPMPPSNRRALEKFIRFAREAGIDAQLIRPHELSRLAEFDALFIRDTTNINHYTYRFAKRAESDGLVVIDDPLSILRCTNKVYLAELLRSHRIPTPKTVIVGKGDLEAVETMLDYPIVLKVPDGAFSRGVFKVENQQALFDTARRLLKESELILGQAFMYTPFDWRIGVLNNQPIYACQYFMSRKHWQIVNHAAKGGAREGGFKAWAIDEVPAKVIKTALAATRLIGNGLYGVDLKQVDDKVYVIEVNDNPNLDAGVEDAVLKDGLYRLLMQEFRRRLDQRRR